MHGLGEVRSDLKIPSFSTPGPLEPGRQLTGAFLSAVPCPSGCHSLFSAWGGGGGGGGVSLELSGESSSS